MTSATTTRPTARSFPAADDLLRRYATPLAAALALVVCVTGVMMFFHWYKGEVEAMHEWLGVGFVGALALHLARHRKPFEMLLAQRRTAVLGVLALLAALAFLPAAPPRAANPVKATVSAVLRAPLREVAPVLGVSEGELIARLGEAGAAKVDAGQSLETVARTRQMPPLALLQAALDDSDRD